MQKVDNRFNNCVGTTCNLHAKKRKKENLDPDLTPFTKMNSRRS